MQKTLQILRFEIITLISRFSFWFGAVGIPLIAFGIYSVVALVNQENSGAAGVTAALSQILEEPEVDLPSGYVDLGGLVDQLPPGVFESQLVSYPDETTASAALSSGEIDLFFIIAADYIQSGNLTIVTPDFNPALLENTDIIEQVLTYNLLEGDQVLIEKVRNPMLLEEISLSPGPVRDQDNALTFFLPYGVTLLFYMLLMGSATLLLSSVSKEKENRVIEILMVSATPTQLLTGKMMGLGIIGLFQLLIWGGSAFVLFQLSGQTFDIPGEFQLGNSILFWGVIFFVLGYLVYAALMSGLGALVPNLREASQASFVISLPLLVPLFLISVLIREPNGPLAVGLSLFPLTSPVTMMLRLASTSVPLWQLLLAVILLVGSVFLAIRAVSGMFRAQTLLSGQQFKLKLFFQALLGRA